MCTSTTDSQGLPGRKTLPSRNLSHKSARLQRGLPGLLIDRSAVFMGPRPRREDGIIHQSLVHQSKFGIHRISLEDAPAT